MSANNEKIGFEHKGLGDLLSHNRFVVPLNQREYSWEDQHVGDLFSDFTQAISDDQATHFLGTIVLTKGAPESSEVTDGQQRLATTTILLAAIRDYFHWAGDKERATTVESSFLRTMDIETTDTIARLTLNIDDREYFEKRVLLSPDLADRKLVQPTKPSHRRIDRAAALAREHLNNVLKPYPDGQRSNQLVKWVKFISKGAQVIALRVPDELNAFRMFETLNDRGLKASQADLLKNYLLGLSADSITQAQSKWSSMVGVLDALGQGDITVTYLHHLLITKYGPTREREVFELVKQTVNSKAKAMQFLTELSDGATDYAALFNSDHKKWNAYGTTTRNHVATINRDLQVSQIRPLMFAVARNFSTKEGASALRMFVPWSVRFLIVGGRGGLLDRNYALRAQEIGTGKVKTASQLAKAMEDILPSDALFEAEFSEARVSLVRLARYYLRALERKQQGQSEPEWVPMDEEQAVNLEHILPEHPQQNWPDVDEETAAAYYRRIGNMVILQAKKNSIIGNSSFSDKKATLKSSTYALTNEVAKNNAWGIQEIEARQRRLAKLAVKTWPLRF